MPIPAYTWLLGSPNGSVLGEIRNAYDRQVSVPVSSTPTASFRLRLDNQYANSVLNDDLLLFVLRDGLCIFAGIIVSAEETADEAGSRQVQVNAAGAFWRYGKRLIPSSRSDAGYSFSGNFIATINSLLDAVNTEAFGGVDHS